MDIFEAEKTGNLRKFTEVVFSSSPQGASPVRYNPGGCKPEKSGKPAGKAKPREH